MSLGEMSAWTMGARGLDKRGSFFKVKGSLDWGIANGQTHSLCRAAWGAVEWREACSEPALGGRGSGGSLPEPSCELLWGFIVYSRLEVL